MVHHRTTTSTSAVASGLVPAFGAQPGAAPRPCLGRTLDSCTRPDT